MRIIHDVPTQLVEHVGSDRLMYVAYAEEINAHDSYLAFFREAVQDRKFVILSSVAQAGEVVVEDLIEAAVALRPSEVVLPNLPCSPEKSALLTAKVSSLLQSAGVDRTSFLAVPHGEDFHGYIENVTKLSNYSMVRTIGVTVDVFDKFHLTRKAFFQAMRKACPRTLHLLGLTDDLTDLNDPLSTSVFRSVQTPKAVVWGLSGTAVRPNVKKVPEYGGRDLFGGDVGFLSFNTDEDAKLATANKNITDWDG